MDDEDNELKEIEDKSDFEKIAVNYLKSWDRRYVPQLRHIIKVREIIKDNGNSIKHPKLVHLLREEYGYNKRIINIMLKRLVETDVISVEINIRRIEDIYYVP